MVTRAIPFACRVCLYNTPYIFLSSSFVYIDSRMPVSADGADARIVAYNTRLEHARLAGVHRAFHPPVLIVLAFVIYLYFLSIRHFLYISVAFALVFRELDS